MSGLLAAGGEAAKAGPIAIVVIALLAVACYFLFRSMSRHLRTVRDDFPDPAEGTDVPGAQAQPPVESP